MDDRIRRLVTQGSHFVSYDADEQVYSISVTGTNKFVVRYDVTADVVTALNIRKSKDRVQKDKRSYKSGTLEHLIVLTVLSVYEKKNFFELEEV